MLTRLRARQLLTMAARTRARSASASAGPAAPPAAAPAPRPHPPPARSGGGEPHVPVLLSAVLSHLAPPPGGRPLRCFVDATLGAGGHSAAMLAAHPGLACLVGLDQDPNALALARPRLAAAAAPATRLHLLRDNFRNLAAALAGLGSAGGADAAGGSCGGGGGPAFLLPPVDALLMDLGFSSMQVDDPARGFSFAREGPLDMRMGGPGGPQRTCEDLLHGCSEAELGDIVREYGEEPRWRAVARAVVARRGASPRLETTAQLAACVADALGFPPRRGPSGGRGPHPATRTFQALRVAVNDELGALRVALPQALAALAPGGRLAIISFHSLEDRLVKRAFREAAGKAAPLAGMGGEPCGGAAAPAGWGPRDPLRDAALYARARGSLAVAGPPPAAPAPPGARLLTPRHVVADDAEVDANPRARSAKLRVLQKL